METHNNVERASELFKAQTHIYKHAFAYANSMALNCAIQLGIPDIIHNHKKSITLPDLLSALKLPSSKLNGIHRLMRLLVHSQFFDITKLEENSETEGYVLTTSSRLLLKSEIPNLSPCVRVMVDPVLVTPWQLLGEWFHKNEEATPFETAHGVPMWDFCAQNPIFDRVFNEGMASDSQMTRLVVKDCREVFEGLNSLVDVGGGTGIVAKTILEAVTHLKCTVLDLPHVVANMPQSENLIYVGGNMFQSIPHADAILLKVCTKVSSLTCSSFILLDIGGGLELQKRNLAAFPHLKCTMLDLLHVIAKMPQTENLKYVGGVIFQLLYGFCIKGYRPSVS
ncbi:trans-resveratrol di-O-methyltransferase-like [Solanum stenotomum]|uniref:trans-resveratrol di-O-methyltransferase-like n=1 Tax=Solanum stenotomum TaxID=172797 RepID=UPI0020D155E1|nr:trans-resveratrol di-O-methyltransferase-like [Solanum stenotomum]